MTVNNRQAAFKQSGSLVTCSVRFEGEAFGRCQQVGQFDPAFTGGVFKAETRFPSRIVDQLRARKRAWPVEYTEAEREAVHLNADRLLLFINVAEPDDEKMQVSLQIDGQAVPVKPAYTSIVRNAPRNTFVGWYADVTHLAPHAVHSLEVELPALKAGQFQGLFFDTVEADYTEEIAEFAAL